MKKISIVVIAVYFLFMFLIYCGIFRDTADPLAVTNYYFKCLKNREGFLTYQISTPDFFNDDKYADLYKKYKLNNVIRIELKLIAIKNNVANVEVNIIYQDKGFGCLVAELKKRDNNWLINDLQYVKK